MEIIIGEMSQIEQSFHKTAVQIFGKKIFSAKDTDILSNILETMGNRNFSHIPVYTEKGNFRGVFSLKSLIFWMNAQKYLINKDITLAEISIDTKQSEYIFIKSNSKVTEIDEYFQEYSEKRKKLWAIFLTKSGTSDDPIEGIITAWDLPMIYGQIQP